MSPRVAILACLACAAPVSAASVADREDAKIERETLLRAADQLQGLQTRIEQLDQSSAELRNELSQLRGDVDALKKENAYLKKNLLTLELNQTKERDALIDEVARMVGRAPAPASNPGDSVASAVAPPDPAPASATGALPTPLPHSGSQEGFEHTVRSGETVTAIARAFRDRGQLVSVEDIIAANRLGPDARISVGQKLFIPKK